MDSGKPIDEYSDNDNTSLGGIETLQYDDDRDSEQSNESNFIYESGSVFEYVEEDDDLFAPESEPFVKEENEEYEEFDEF